MFTTSPTGRACGRRVRSGVYAENRLSEDGLPIEYFIVDPPPRSSSKHWAWPRSASS